MKRLTLPQETPDRSRPGTTGNPLVHELVRGVEVVGAAAWRKAS